MTTTFSYAGTEQAIGSQLAGSAGSGRHPILTPAPGDGLAHLPQVLVDSLGRVASAIQEKYPPWAPSSRAFRNFDRYLTTRPETGLPRFLG
jgi:hypothetical protein